MTFIPYAYSFESNKRISNELQPSTVLLKKAQR